MGPEKLNTHKVEKKTIVTPIIIFEEIAASYLQTYLKLNIIKLKNLVCVHFLVNEQ